MYKKQKVFRKYVFSSYRTNKLIKWFVDKKNNIEKYIRNSILPFSYLLYDL